MAARITDWLTHLPDIVQPSPFNAGHLRQTVSPPASQSDRPKHSPNKRSYSEVMESTSWPGGDEHGAMDVVDAVEADDAATPTKKRLIQKRDEQLADLPTPLVSLQPSFSYQASEPSISLASPHTGSQATESRSSSPKKRKTTNSRSSSPIKQKSELRLSDPSIHFEIEYREPLFQLRDKVPLLSKLLAAIGESQSIPAGLQACIIFSIFVANLLTFISRFSTLTRITFLGKACPLSPQTPPLTDSQTLAT